MFAPYIRSRVSQNRQARARLDVEHIHCAGLLGHFREEALASCSSYKSAVNTTTFNPGIPS
jgi:hypothetical protein